MKMINDKQDCIESIIRVLERTAAWQPPPDSLMIPVIDTWNTFREELPWLNRSHRAPTEIAATVRSRIMLGDDIVVKALSLLRQCLGQMGATPSDASKVWMPDDETPDDPSTKYFAYLRNTSHTYLI
jgi:hypothetical protein